MHQNRFKLRLGPKPRWRSLQRFPVPVAGFKPTSKKGELEEKGRERKKKKEKERERWKKGGRGGEPDPTFMTNFTPMHDAKHKSV